MANENNLKSPKLTAGAGWFSPMEMPLVIYSVRKSRLLFDSYGAGCFCPRDKNENDEILKNIRGQGQILANAKFPETKSGELELILSFLLLCLIFETPHCKTKCPKSVSNGTATITLTQ